MSVIEVDINDFHKNPEVLANVRADLEKMLGLDNEQEYVVEIDCPYAQYVEFGSDPYDPGKRNITPRVHDDICGDEVTETNLRIRDWAQEKLGLTPEMRKKRGDTIYHELMDNGMKPRPFIRPARNDVIEDLAVHPDRYMMEGKNTSENIAREMRANMIRYLAAHKAVTTGDLMKSIQVVKATETSDIEPPADLKEIEDYIWQDPSLDRHGKKITGIGGGQP